MKNGMSPQMAETVPEPTRSALTASLPRWEDLPTANQQELIQALAALLMRLPELQALLEVRHEPGE
jgi:hypothetical protein